MLFPLSTFAPKSIATPRLSVNAPRGFPNPEEITGDNLWKIAYAQFQRNIGRTKWAGEIKRVKEAIERMSKGRGANKRSRTVNPADERLDKAYDISQRWHGRPTEEVVELAEEEKYNDTCAVLGFLCGLNILDPRDCRRYVEMEFPYHPDPIEGVHDPDTIKLVTNLEENSVELVDGDQTIDLDAFDWLTDKQKSKDRVKVGSIFSISYFTDKHHLEGPKRQSKGIEYEHEFSEEESKKVEGRVEFLPELVVDTRNNKMLIVGGSYEVTELGLRN